MANLNQLIITSANYRIFLSVPTLTSNKVFQLLTVDGIDWDDASEGESIYAIGQEDPIGEKSNANKYSGKLTLQVGEWNALLALCGFNTGIQIRNATLSITALIGGYVKVYQAVNINRDGSSTKAKDKQSLTSLDFNAIGLAS